MSLRWLNVTSIPGQVDINISIYSTKTSSTMVLISELELKKRAEHNYGRLFDLEEISLHQLNIRKIENLDKFCRNLKIIYLQDNAIMKLENLKRLKLLEYLNVSMNAIEVVEGLENCESLRKLDLTLNFIGKITSIYSLRKVHSNNNDMSNIYKLCCLQE